MNLAIVGKTYLADFRLFSCIQHPNYIVYDKVLTIIKDNYNIIINSICEYDKILSAIKIFYWLSTTVFYFRGSAAIAEIILNGLLKYILNDDNFRMTKKDNTFPDIEAMLEPDEEYYVNIFLTQFNFNTTYIEYFRTEYIKKRNIYCNQFDDNEIECKENNCWYYKDSKKCKIKYDKGM